MTYSIVARDPETGELGVAVQSRSFNTGAGVPWALPGVGAIATQSVAERRYGYRGLELLAARESPADALAALRESDELERVRQVAILDAEGRIAQHTGSGCIPAAGHAHGDVWAAQANMVDSSRVWEGMGTAFEAADGILARRLLAALDAAEAAGGDWRGRQAGAILVVPGEGEPWERVIDLRVEDSGDPLGELRRLLNRAEAYRAIRRAEDGREELARRGGLPELDVRWAAVYDALAADDVERARRLFRPLADEEPRWKPYALLLADVGVHPNARELVV